MIVIVYSWDNHIKDIINVFKINVVESVDEVKNKLMIQKMIFSVKVPNTEGRVLIQYKDDILPV